MNELITELICAKIAEQNITSVLMGDPPPGRSALDQKRKDISADTVLKLSKGSKSHD